MTDSGDEFLRRGRAIFEQLREPTSEPEPEPEPVTVDSVVEGSPVQADGPALPHDLEDGRDAVGAIDGAEPPPAVVAEPDLAPDRFTRPLPRTIAIANQKGGVGKTTTAVNLGAAIADLGYRVLVVDLDPQGNATTGLGLNPRDLQTSMYDVMLHDAPIEDCVEATSVRNLFVAPSSLDLAGAEIELVPAFSRELRLKRALEEVKDDYDFVLIDCPPSLGLLTVNSFAAATEVLVPIQCEYYTLEGLGQLLRNVGLVQRNLNDQLEVSVIVLVMHDARTKLSDQVVQEVRTHFAEKVSRTVIPRTVRLSEAPSFGQPITAFDPTSRGAVAYRELAKEVSGACRSGLGKGLGALIPSEVTAVQQAGSSLIEVPVSAVTSNRHQPRQAFDEEALASLTASIREVGVLQPILVRPAGDDEYELIAGERRWRAAKRAGLPTVPAIVRTIDDSSSLEHTLVENLHRQDLNPLEEAAAYQQLIEDFSLTHDEVATRVGKSRAAVTNTLRLFQLPPAVQKLVVDGALSAGHARALLGTPIAAFQEHLARRAVKEGLTVRDVEETVRQRNELGGHVPDDVVGDGPVPTPTPMVPKLRPPGLLELEELFSHHLDTSVKVTMGPRRGKVQIDFADLEDLERLYRVITQGRPEGAGVEAADEVTGG